MYAYTPCIGCHGGMVVSSNYLHRNYLYAGLIRPLLYKHSLVDELDWFGTWLGMDFAMKST